MRKKRKIHSRSVLSKKKNEILIEKTSKYQFSCKTFCWQIKEQSLRNSKTDNENNWQILRKSERCTDKNEIVLFKQHLQIFLEERAIRMCFIEKLMSKMSQISSENTDTGVIFLIKLQTYACIAKKDAIAVICQ